MHSIAEPSEGARVRDGLVDGRRERAPHRRERAHQPTARPDVATRSEAKGCHDVGGRRIGTSCRLRSIDTHAGAVIQPSRDAAPFPFSAISHRVFV
jgi:hypothetical protein